MRDHAFRSPVIQHAVMGHEGRVYEFNLLADAANARTVAYICFISYLAGPGEKVILRDKAKKEIAGDDE